MSNKILPKHQEKAEDESRCFDYSLDLAKQFESLGNYDKAIAHIENASRSLKSLQDMRDMYIDAYTIKPQDVRDYE